MPPCNLYTGITNSFCMILVKKFWYLVTVISLNCVRHVRLLANLLSNFIAGSIFSLGAFGIRRCQTSNSTSPAL